MISNKISTQVEQYLEYKHSLGFKLEGESSDLRSFSRHTIEQGYEGSLTMDIVFSWLASSGNQTDKSLGLWDGTFSSPPTAYYQIFQMENNGTIESLMQIPAAVSSLSRIRSMTGCWLQQE